MEVILIDQDLRLVPYYPCPEVTLEWYQDPQLCLQVDNTTNPYTLEVLEKMYHYLSTYGRCYYIEYLGQLAGDITLLDNGELCIVVAPEFQNQHLGRRSVQAILELAERCSFEEVHANVYHFNHQSQRMFEAIGFERVAEEWYQYWLDKN